MRWYTWRFEVRSPLVTPPHADTLFGHICWAIRMRGGNAAIEDFLERYERHVPLVLSELFPSGWLPTPVADLSDGMGLSGKPRVPFVSLTSVLDGTLATTDHRAAMVAAQADGTWPEVNQTIAARNVVDRRGGGTLEQGGFFQVREFHYPPGRLLDLHFLAVDVDEARMWIADGLAGGFGADKSIGRGWLHPDGKPERVPYPDHGGRRMALAGFVPAPGTCSDLQGRTRMKFGRLGGLYASAVNPAIGTHRPFKKPVMMFRPGTTVEAGSEQWAGVMVRDVHADPSIRQYALAPLLPLGPGTGG